MLTLYRAAEVDEGEPEVEPARILSIAEDFSTLDSSCIALDIRLHYAAQKLQAGLFDMIEKLGTKMLNILRTSGTLDDEGSP
jgi:hypothetical protein